MKRVYKVICGKDELYCDNRDEAIVIAKTVGNDEAHRDDPVYVISESLIWFDGKTYKNGKVIDVDA